MDNCVFAVVTGPGLSPASNRMLERVDILEKSCNLGVKGVHLQVLLLFNQGWCLAPNVVSHGLQIDGVLAMKPVGANATNMTSGICLACERPCNSA